MPCPFLIVDADRNFREAMAIALRLDGYAVEVAASAEEAVERLASGHGFCCVVDAHLFAVDVVLGAAARAGLRVVLTGPHADLLAAASRRHPTAELLPKPFRAAELTRGCGSTANGVVALGGRR